LLQILPRSGIISTHFEKNEDIYATINPGNEMHLISSFNTPLISYYASANTPSHFWYGATGVAVFVFIVEFVGDCNNGCDG
jgi:hypothetical protein